jgi:hypothetical protein
MSFVRTVFCLVLFGGLALAAGVDDLVRDLGSDDFKKREAATQALSEAGPDAIPALEKAAQDKDPEVRWRAEKALLAIRSRARPGAAAEKPDGAKRPAEAEPPDGPPELGSALERARRRLQDVQDNMGRIRPELKDFLRGFGGGDFGKEFNRIFEDMERRFRDLDHDQQPPLLRDFWSFRFRDGKWELVKPEGETLFDRVGVRTEPAPPVLRAQLKLPEGAPEGVVVEDVLEKGAAAVAGVKKWDLLLEVDGRPVASEADLEPLTAPGKHRLSLIRGGEPLELSLVTPAPPSPDAAPLKPAPAPEPEKPAPAKPSPRPKEEPPKEELRKY